jgi:hypothetical protein
MHEKSQLNNNYLTIHEIIIFFTNSWLNAFMIVFSLINKNHQEEFKKLNIYIPQKLQYLQSYVYQNEVNLKNYILSSLRDVGVDLSKGVVDYISFKKWIIIDHTLEINYYKYNYKFAISLVCLEGIGLYFDELPDHSNLSENKIQI